MPEITYVTAAGESRSAHFDAGDDVMSVALENDISGIEGECGGFMICGTCHVYLDDEWQQQFDVPDDDEEDRLESLESRTSSSRLGCQLRLGDNHNGLSVTVATEVA